MFAALASVGAFLLAALAIVVVSTKSTSSGGGSAAAPVAVKLSEFKIEPGAISLGKGGKLDVSNVGSQVHNLAVSEADLITPDLNGGESAALDTSSLKPGNYTVVCLIPGHEASGMKGTLTVSENAGPSAAAGSGSSGEDASSVDWASHEDAHNATIQKYATAALTTAKGLPTEGTGNQPMTPKVVTGPAQDTKNSGDVGSQTWKQFDLTTKIIDWEVEPGKMVKAWAYCDNDKGDEGCQVPGPLIKVNTGDWVRVTLKNELPASTDIHFHGITTPFYADGVATLTQDFIQPGESWTYEFQAMNEPELGMYHAHIHGQEAVVNGLFAVFQVGELDVSKAAGLKIPSRTETVSSNLTGIPEVPLVLNDAGVIGLSINGKAYPATDPVISEVDQPMLIHYYSEGLQIHPMHLHHVPQLVVAKDGFPLAQPYWADTVNVAPGERYTVLIQPTGIDLALKADGTVAEAPALKIGDVEAPGVGVWAFHCHILTHAEGDQGLLGMVTVLAVLPKGTLDRLQAAG
jgi:FtsP/CotA-like multicopper oxidase with cupredoxin domain/plastocyanin